MGSNVCIITSDCDDRDGDGYCEASDCDNDSSACNESCADADDDGVRGCDSDCDDDNPDCAADCTDGDGDGVCVDADSDDNNANCGTDGTDADTDGYCAGVDCDDNAQACTTDCVDTDGDGVPVCAADCDDTKPNCTSNCTDGDNDGYCIGHDCNDALGFCTEDCTNVDGDDYCAPFDCDDTVAGCDTDCIDIDSDDVWACEGDCDDQNPNCGLLCADVDGDGYCEDFDCDDTLAPCTEDCSTDTDADGDANCVEIACHTDPGDATDDCVVVDGTSMLPGDILADLPGAIQYAAANTAVTEKLLILDSTTVDAQLEIGGDACAEVRAAAGVVLSMSVDDDMMFRLSDDNCLLDGLVMEGGQITVAMDGDGSEVRGCEIRNWDNLSAIRVWGNDNRIVDNFIHGGLSSGCDGCAAVFINNNPARTRVVGNLIVDNAGDGIQMRAGSADTFIDHNTIANNDEAAIEVSNTASQGVCMRNNIFAGNGQVALRVRNNNITWATTGCTEPLSPDPDPHWGNNIIGNLTGECDGDRCANCTCLPTGEFWQFQNTPPGFVDQVDYCLDSGIPSLLIDAGAAVEDTDAAYDRNYAASGRYVGSAPDIGGREAGAGVCAP